jgi:thioredoxin-related protein
MKKLQIKILLIFLFSQLYLNAQVNFVEYKADLFQRSLKENKPIFIVFTAKWCGQCKSMKNEVFTDSALAELLNKNYICINIDVDNDKSELGDKYNIVGLPGFIFLSPKGDLIYQCSGFYEIDDFTKKANYVLKKLKGTTTDTDELYACMDSDNQNCDELLSKFIINNDWKKNEENALLILQFMDRGNEVATKSFYENKAELRKIIPQDKFNDILYFVALSKAHDILDPAEKKKIAPDWKKVEKIFIEIYSTDYQKDLAILKSNVAYRLRNFDDFLKNKEIALEYDEKNIADAEKALYYYRFFLMMFVLSDDFDKKSDLQNKALHEFYYKILKKIEKYLKNPSITLFRHLFIVCDYLGKTEEADAYSEKFTILINDDKLKDELEDVEF